MCLDFLRKKKEEIELIFLFLFPIKLHSYSWTAYWKWLWAQTIPCDPHQDSLKDSVSWRGSKIILGYLQTNKRKGGCKPVLAPYPNAIIITNTDIVTVDSDSCVQKNPNPKFQLDPDLGI